MTSKTITVMIPSRHGQAETKRRLEDGVRNLRTQYANQIASVEETWTGDRMDFKVAALGQSLTGRLEVLAEAVKVEMDLPWLLAAFADKIKAEVEQRGRKLLEKK
jgi:putative polyhydroxyalkanoate system protein